MRTHHEESLLIRNGVPPEMVHRLVRLDLEKSIEALSARGVFGAAKTVRD